MDNNINYTNDNSEGNNSAKCDHNCCDMIMIRTCGDNNSQVDNNCNYKNDFQNIARRNV